MSKRGVKPITRFTLIAKVMRPMVASRKATNTAFFKSNEVSNATGCSSIYGGSDPATPYCRNYRSGFGPA